MQAIVWLTNHSLLPSEVPTEDKIIEVYLNPGQYFIGDERHRISTLLGSCVSIALWHPVKRIGALSHFLLSSHGFALPATLDARYGDDAMVLMLRDLNLRKVNVRECQAKIFGGGNMFPAYTGSGLSNIGMRNGEEARRMLAAQGIPVVSESLFGNAHRRLVFDIKTGEVLIRQVDIK